MLKKIIIAIALAGLVSGAAYASATESTANAAVEAATKAQKKAKSVGGEWRDVGSLIKKAKKAIKKGEYEKAVKLAKKAEKQGEDGYEQSVSQKGVGNPLYLYQ